MIRFILFKICIRGTKFPSLEGTNRNMHHRGVTTSEIEGTVGVAGETSHMFDSQMRARVALSPHIFSRMSGGFKRQMPDIKN